MNELFQRPANYWLRHAQRHRQSGDLIRAAVLQRHALRAEPDSEAARVQYALTLRQLRCWEASNREAFRALAAHPDQAELYGLIGCNLIYMGQEEAGLDALGCYLRAPIPAIAPWHDEACGLSDLYPDPLPRKRRQARLNGLLHIAASRLSRGDAAGARRALHRAQKRPYQAPNGRREMLLAACALQQGHARRCALHLHSAVRLRPFDIATLAGAAALCGRLGLRAPSRMLLLRAAALARTPQDMHLVCHAADGLNMIFLAQGMLKRALGARMDRCPVLYDLCVCALKLGRMQEAARCIHLCREIDPDDVPSECLFARVMDWQQQGLAPEALRKAARGVSFYGGCTAGELDACARPLLDALSQGGDALGRAVQQDERLRGRLLFLLTLPLEWPTALLQTACEHLPPAQSQMLLRQTLLQHPADSPARRYALSALHAMGAPGPYAAWTRERFVLVDFDRLYAPVPTFRQRRLTRFLRRLAAENTSAVIPWALGVVSRMTPHQQCRLLGDPWKVWPMAMTLRWRARNALPPARVAPQNLSIPRLAALQKALKTLQRIDRGGKNHADH